MNKCGQDVPTTIQEEHEYALHTVRRPQRTIVAGRKQTKNACRGQTSMSRPMHRCC